MNKTTLSIIVSLVVLAAGYLLFDGGITPKREAVESSVVELKDGDTFDLTASYVTKKIAGKKQTMLAYNGSIPGPTIRVPQGAEVTVNFKNDTDIPALLHSHGVRMENRFDGSQSVQEEMKPGESFSYRLKFPDDGIYWYHPHVKESFAQSRGLYGAFVVTPYDTESLAPVNREIPLFLSDILIRNGEIGIQKDAFTHSLMGSFGNVMLVNGEENYSLNGRTGETIRLYVVNSANARPFNFAINGLKMKLVGGDSGAYEKETWAESVVLGPSERAIVEVMFAEAGTYEIENRTPGKTYNMGEIVVSEESVTPSYVGSFSVLKTHDEIIKSIDSFRAYFGKAPDKQIKLSVDFAGSMGAMMGGGHVMPDGTMMGGMMMHQNGDGIEWEDDMGAMNSASTPESIKWHIIDEDTDKKDMDIDWTFKNGEPVKIRIFNDPNSAHPMQHPIHFHGQRFLVVERNGVRQTNLVWKDTALVKSGETVDIVLDPSNLGKWMAHCHISEHLEAGMMFEFKVE